MRNSILTTLAALCLSACDPGATPADKIPATATAREDAPGLTQTYAEFRASQVHNAHYELDVELDPTLDYFSGENRIRFDWSGGSSDLTIDFAGGDVDSVNVNGVDIDASYNEAVITVPAAALAAGANEILVHFSHAWSDDGAGLYRYDDPDDGRTYLYTDFEPYEANSAFPLFDQPDIKGRFTLSVTAPNDWIVVSTSKETSVQPSGETTQTWSFQETAPVPGYVFSLHAGPYHVWQDQDFRIPLRLFVRQSLSDYVAPDAEMWFQFTRAGLNYFEDYYGIDYPYAKFDQLIVPDFNYGAMENAAAVTFNERGSVQRDGWTSMERNRLNRVILHEMAHMWFGDLVTMKWWNGLWLNETFAEFMAYHAESAGNSSNNPWHNFFLDGKYIAYWTDQRRTTHPVETPVADTDSIEANFDMISYAKGASVLRQIEYRLGKEVFRKGINTYLTRHAEGNAVLQDFVSALEAAANTNLDDWAMEWLYTAGANTVEAQYSCVDDRVTEFALAQTAPPGYPILRTQKVQVALLRDVDGAVITEHVLPVTYSGALTALPEAIGKACPDLVYPNHDDMGYLLVKFDPRTRANLGTMIGRIEDSFQRVMFWQTLWDNVRFAQIPVTDYLDAVFASASAEVDINNVDQVYAFVGSAIDYLRHMQEQGAAAVAKYRPLAESITWANIERTGGDLQTMYLDRYLAFASSDAALEKYVRLLTGNTEIPGRDLDQDRRWSILRMLSAEGHDQVDALLASEESRDPSDNGRRWVLRIEAARPDMAAKRAVLADLMNKESDNTYASQRLAMSSLFPTGQEQLHEVFADAILQQILDDEADPDPQYYLRARGFATYLVPTNCTEASVKRLESAVAAHANSRSSIREILIEKQEDDELCVRRAALIQ
jgi:aminopeptidase N